MQEIVESAANTVSSGMSANDWASLLRDLVVSAVAVFTVVVAFKELQSWKREQSATIGHELARRVIAAVIEYRDAVSHVRHGGFISSSLREKALKDAGINTRSMDEHQIDFEGERQIYIQRLNEARGKLLAVRDLEKEAEAVVGPDFRGMSRDLDRLGTVLEVAFKQVFRWRSEGIPDGPQGERLQLQYEKQEDILEGLTPEEDEYGEKIEEACEMLIKRFRPFLHKIK